MKPREDALVVRAGAWTCALPLPEVVETMRELPCLPCKGAPGWVRGASIVRGVPVAVVDLAAFLGSKGSLDAGRFVTVRTGESRVALRVDAVLGIRPIPAGTQRSRLLDGAAAAHSEELATLDGHLLALLELGTLLPSDFRLDVLAGAAE
jgi:chemotaxis signal transduction protein